MQSLLQHIRAPARGKKRNILAAVAVLLAAAGVAARSEIPADQSTAEHVAAVVRMTNSMTFEPANVTIRAGQAVKWENQSYVVHTATAVPDKAKNPRDVHLPHNATPFDSGAMQSGATFTHTFNVPGRYKYFCIPHELIGMIGEVLVQPAEQEGAASEVGQTPAPPPAPTNTTAGKVAKTPGITFVPGGHLPPRPPHYREATGFLKYVYWLGNFHPPATDMPVALILAAFLSEVLLMATGKTGFAVSTRYCVWVGGLAALGAACLGWCFAGFQLSDDVWMLATHRILGSVTGLWGLVTIALLELSRAKRSAGWTWTFRGVLATAVVLVIATGFFGGAMIYGLNHYGWPN